MQDMSRMLSRLENIAGYDVLLVSVSSSYVKLEQRVSLDPSCTIKKLVQMKFPWIQLKSDEFAVGFGVCTKNEPQSMKWNTGRVVMNTEIRDLWPDTPLSENEEYLLVCSMFSREQYNRQKNRLDLVLGEMGKWIPPPLPEKRVGKSVVDDHVN